MEDGFFRMPAWALYITIVLAIFSDLLKSGKVNLKDIERIREEAEAAANASAAAEQ